MYPDRTYAESIVATVREPLLVLDADLKVVSANRSFYQTFKVSPEKAQGQLLYDLGNRQWDIPKLRELLEEVLPRNTSFNDFEVEHDLGRFVDAIKKLGYFWAVLNEPPPFSDQYPNLAE